MTDGERLESLKKQLVNHEDGLLLIEERMSEYILVTEISLELKKHHGIKVKTIERLKEQIEALTAKLAKLPENIPSGEGIEGMIVDAALPPAPPVFSFVAGPPITHPGYFFGREKVVRRIFGLWKNLPLQHAAIIGAKRTGKTSLLHLCETLSSTPTKLLRPGQRNDLLPAAEQYRWLFLDFQDARLATQSELMTYILQHLGFPVPNPCDMATFTNVMIQHLQKPTILLMDEVGVAIEKYADLDPNFWEGLRSLATNHVGGKLGFVVAAHSSPMRLAKQTGNSSPFFGIFAYTVTLKPFSEEEARGLIAHSPIPFSDEDVTWILGKSGHWPILLQILCRERLIALEDGDQSEDWKEEGLAQIEPFAELLTIG